MNAVWTADDFNRVFFYEKKIVFDKTKSNFSKILVPLMF